LLQQGSVVELDHGVARFSDNRQTVVKRYFLNEASTGFSAETVRAVNRSTKVLGGKVSFLAGVAKCLLRLENRPLEIRVDNKLWYSGSALLAAISNGKYFGGGMMIAPDASMKDGLLDVVVIESLTRFEVMKHIGKIYGGEHLTLSQVRVKRGRHVEITAADPIPMEMDGEQPGTLNASFGIAEKHIRFLLPSLPNHDAETLG
jgi:diacylglycerol kinase family enzyme